MGRIDRREFLRDIGLASAWLSLLPGVAIAGRRGGLRAMGPSKRIVVLGGGLAGLSAAFELKNAGHDVTVLEARKQPGGRVRTLRSFPDGLYAEAGAVAFPQSHSFTWGYATDFGLPLRLAFKIGLEALGHIQGQQFRIGPSAGPIPLDLTARERAAGIIQLPTLYLGKYMRDVGEPRGKDWPPENLRELDNISLKQLLRDEGASEAAIDVIDASQLGVLGFGIDSISALDGVVTEAIATGSPFYEIAGGNDQLAKAFKKRLKKRFQKKSEVLKVEQNETQVTVTYDRKGVIETITADRVICTLPFPVLNDIEIFPPLSPEKQQAVDELKLTPVTRTYMQCRNKIWEQSGLDGTGITDLVIQNTYSSTLTQPGARGILTSYTGGQRALDLGDMTEKDRQDLVVRRGGNLFGALRSNYETGISQIWHKDRWARGAFAYFEPGQMTTLLPIAQRPEGRIHFAGEHTSGWHGWMNGALESGNRAASEVNKAESEEAILISSREPRP